MPIERELTTARLVLRPISLQDLDDVWPGVSDPEIARHMSWEPHSDPAETRQLLERLSSDEASGRGVTWTIRRGGEFCGIFSLINVLRSHRALTYNRAELAYWCLPRFQRQGIMREAGDVVVDFAFGALALNRLIVGHHLENTASERLILHLGFSPIGDEHQAFSKHGRWIDIRMYELLRSRHLARRPNSAHAS